jgi:hypothetical protein
MQVHIFKRSILNKPTRRNLSNQDLTFTLHPVIPNRAKINLQKIHIHNLLSSHIQYNEYKSSKFHCVGGATARQNLYMQIIRFYVIS